MPDHVHLVIQPQEGTSLGKVIGQLKGTVSYKSPRVNGPMWNRRCFDHNCRSISAAREKLDYCHNNPVRKGLVDRASDWRWSSAAWYEGRRDVPIAMDSFEL